jgi:membrane protease YdiL (CAAX protease family)
VEPRDALTLAALAAAIVAYYRVPQTNLAFLSGSIVRSLGLARRYPPRDADALVRLPLAGLSQALFCCLLLLATRADVGRLVGGRLSLVLLVYAPLLGLGELAVARFVGELAIRAGSALGSPVDLRSPFAWQALGSSGWMQRYTASRELLPRAVWIATVGLYVAGEELVFRGAVLSYLGPILGPAGAVALSVLLFALVQTFDLPSWRAALLPLSGALVVGVVHGVLFVSTGAVPPLVVAHFVFFAVATE